MSQELKLYKFAPLPTPYLRRMGFWEEKLDVTLLTAPVTESEMHSTHEGLTYLKTESIFSILTQTYQPKIR